MSSDLFREVDKYLVRHEGAKKGDVHGNIYRAWNMLDAGASIDDQKERQVRQTSRARILQKTILLRAGFHNESAMMAREAHPDAADQRPWLFDGLHRWRAIEYLLKHEPPPTTLHRYTPDFPIPVVLYKHTMPDALCRRYGMFTNDLAAVSQAGTFMDCLRFLHNEQSAQSDVGQNTTVCSPLSSERTTHHVTHVRRHISGGESCSAPANAGRRTRHEPAESRAQSQEHSWRTRLHAVHRARRS